ncbi:iron-containing alcohol dehydrogenase [Georgenia sp. TF02-10]|uniref:iron-containing alcohol dehydrogenase n=1 Tax=Georgenia sp. TF02-10 TaxID=2917725 RepID=UPI001FA730A4|nr:iron-containing alcohol dehydrogenase [Georgenia sp. TF02-10]UNX55769.1 iron-containing alcohol dehydrogenase [Georgenia sp. TF02-10]
MRFTHDPAPVRAVFGRGVTRTALPAELHRLGRERLLVLVPPDVRALARELTQPLGPAVVGWFTGVERQVPAAVAARAVATARDVRADAVLAIGDGAATGTAKVLARDTGLPVLAVPTGYAGWDLTGQWSVTTAGRTETGTDPAVRPRTVLLDPDLTDALPRRAAVTAAFQALARAVEAHWAPSADPVTSALADEAVRTLAAGLRARAGGQGDGARDGDLLTDPVGTWAGTAARAGEELLYGAFLAAAAMDTAGTGLQHALSRALGTALDLPAAATHAVLLPHVLAFNAPALPAAVHERLAAALGADRAAVGLRELAALTGAPRTLADIGLRPADLPEAIARASAQLPVPNPRPVGTEEVRALLLAAAGIR